MLFTRWITCCVAILGLFSMNCLQASSGVKGNRADYVVVGVGTAGSLMAKRLRCRRRQENIGYRFALGSKFHRFLYHQIW